MKKKNIAKKNNNQFIILWKYTIEPYIILTDRKHSLNTTCMHVQQNLPYAQKH